MSLFVVYSSNPHLVLASRVRILHIKARDADSVSSAVELVDGVETGAG